MSIMKTLKLVPYYFSTSDTLVKILYIALCILPNKVFEAQKRPAEKPALFLFIA